jgi:hypothetical protein
MSASNDSKTEGSFLFGFDEGRSVTGSTWSS